MPDHAERRRHVVQHLGDVLAEPAQRAAATRARAGRRVLHDDAGKVPRQRPPRGPLESRPRRGRHVLGTVPEPLALAGLQLLKGERELRELGVQPLGRLAELRAPQPRYLQLELLDQHAVVVQLVVLARNARGLRLGQRADPGGQRGGIDHARFVEGAAAPTQRLCVAQPAISGCRVRAGMRQ